MAFSCYEDCAPGTTLKDVSSMNEADTDFVVELFTTAVLEMQEKGYALYDFHEENILWDASSRTLPLSTSRPPDSPLKPQNMLNLGIVSHG